MALGEILPDLLVYVTKASSSEHAADDFLRQLASSTNQSEREKALKISKLLALPLPDPKWDPGSGKAPPGPCGVEPQDLSHVKPYTPKK